MTIETTSNKIQYVSDGITAIYDYDFPVLNASDMLVYVGNDLYEQPYTVNGLGSPNGGTVELQGDIPAADLVITFIREVEIDQQVDYQPYDPFPAETHEGALDKLTTICQQLAEELSRAYKAPIDTLPGADISFPDYSPGALLGWSETEANIIVNSPYVFQDYVDVYEDCQEELVKCQAEVLNCKQEVINCQTEVANAAAQAASAQQSSILSQQWAANPEDVPVDGDLFSARHYAIKALKARAGLSVLGPIDASDTCPKPGDDPGDCNAPDYRNPSQRFPARVWNPGDSFIVRIAGNMTLNDLENPGSTTVVPLDVGNYIVYTPEIRDGDGNLILAEGWFAILGLEPSGTIAELVAFDDSNTTIKGENVQLWNEAADTQIENIQDVINDLGSTYLPLAGGTMLGALILAGEPSDALDAATKAYVDSSIANIPYPFPVGTRMIFATAAAPAPWVSLSGFDDAMLRIVNPENFAGTTGTVGVSQRFTASSPITGQTAEHVLTVAQMPSHTHPYEAYSLAAQYSLSNNPVRRDAIGGTTGATGGNAGHSHGITATVDLSVKYTDSIVGELGA